MEFDAVLIAPRRAASVAQGLWHDKTINTELDACVAHCPDKLALTAVQAHSGAVERMTYRELAAMADRVAVGLTRLGVRRNDTVACQLPNWWQFTVTYLACSRIGAVMNPLMHILREHELSFMLKHGQARVVIVPKVFRGFDFEAMLAALRPALPDLQHVVVVGGAGDNSFEKLLSAPAREAAQDALGILTRHRPGPDDVTQLIYTSGTTGEPKGVMHTANTLMANIIPYARRLKLGAGDVVLMASPMAHQTGFMYGLMMPILLRQSVVLLDIWEPLRAIDLIRSEAVGFTMASTPFLADLARNVQESGKTVPTLKIFLCAGAPIPGSLVEQARRVLGSKIVSAWGMTENGAVTTIGLDDEDERAINTDGCPLPGVALKVVDTDGSPLPAGQAGKLYVRSCSNFGGYLGRPHLNGTDAEGWFDTGDLARIDERGYVRITGRSKDVIIRGGENIPVVEIESLLYRHPAIALAAIVAYPDERLGERACAVVVPKAGQTVDLPAIVEFLRSQKVAAQYIPERLVVRASIPSTPSGKMQKFKLREMLREELRGGP
ncbi:cyclohexanecarboxylate-CoA ligase [Verminephrobacter eiseniae]|uniref:cyclohexanecarboxylate-CoA ligase n=1 Tax=Verminephrobacter eiseniae TaxID=364317 RepID=UPI00223755A3|nr:cyclohexanecarboxylate-CoA ligase [Verminephrobacter eiseniae]MCW5285324.1 cyclohexanecarboxylate-CoA ligase [Verminephrobacter eiseniae]MCW5303032.1 cyclohexanecarboxylate-CoA ligase [Verminephrobacter eiseniae]MCW8179646.1 cyclohexanecarboxylate-CoA ligase [Verminephrobacter eiseniae]MCW8190468.1 cyclohexanecarboxylate-CoA ligase [Verminephrobacter eiseniae]